jgi:transcriptional regulator GlxA family with amidase domain
MLTTHITGFRLGIYVFKDAEVIDFAAPHGVFSVARRFDPELDAFLIADSMRPVQAQAGFTVLPNYSFSDYPAMDAFLIPGGFGTRQEMYNRRLHEFIRSLPQTTLLTSVCTGFLGLCPNGAARWASCDESQGARSPRSFTSWESAD